MHILTGWLRGPVRISHSCAGQSSELSFPDLTWVAAPWGHPSGTRRRGSALDSSEIEREQYVACIVR